MADSVATRVARHRAKKRAAGVTRLTIELDQATAGSIRRLCKQHGKTRRQVIELGIAAAASLLSGHLQIVKQAQPARLIIQQQPPQRPVAPSEPSANTDAPPPPENAATAQQGKPEQAIADDADARIRACAFTVET